MKAALAQINTTVGDIPGNEAKILAAYERGAAAGADIVVLPELTLTGYPPRDLVLNDAFVAKNLAALERLAAQTGKTALALGFIGHNEVQPGRKATNAIALLQHGKIVTTRAKTLLPTYDVFDEDRYFEPATENAPVDFNTVKIGLTICEDVWNDEDFWDERRYQRNPAAELASAGVKLILNASASPWHLGKNRTRRELLSRLAVKSKCPVVYCNLVGGNDELIFDGNSLVFNAAGELLAEGKMFAEDFLLVDLESTSAE
jgi:NAD+ synthase (glutamine-hydrolysing)